MGHKVKTQNFRRQRNKKSERLEAATCDAEQYLERARISGIVPGPPKRAAEQREPEDITPNQRPFLFLDNNEPPLANRCGFVAFSSWITCDPIRAMKTHETTSTCFQLS
jgi:hypothetical protein